MLNKPTFMLNKWLFSIALAEQPFVQGFFVVFIENMCISKRQQLRTTTGCSGQPSAEQTHPYAEQLLVQGRPP
jgi:hypothetical protein